MMRISMPRAGLIAAAAWLGGIMPMALAQTTTSAPRAIPAADSAPSIVNIMPPGATLGQVTEWTVVGRNVKLVDRWMVSGSGVEVIGATARSDTAAALQIKVDPAAEPGFREVRAVGPGGFSNLAIVRIDALKPVAEVEPNDGIDQPTFLPQGGAAWGILKAQDLDYFRVEGKAGERITIDLEAQRLGSPVVPVLTLLTATGAALAQARETRGLDHDARISAILPADGGYLIQVRDTLYEGGDAAIYRLRVSGERFATGIFPPGGPAGATITVFADGGSLEAPRSKTITLPDTPGTLVDPGPFDGPDGPALVPMKLLVGSGPEVQDAPSGDETPIRLPPGSTASGRISRPGEVDRFAVPVRKGEILSIRIRASEMGSWLDSVVTVRDISGAVVVENDDPVNAAPQRNAFVVNQTQAPPDSRITHEAQSDGDVIVEVADRFGEGGPAYGYRLEVGPPRPDFAISFLFSDPAANRRNLALTAGRAPRATGVGQTGAINIRPGSSLPINFLVTAEGATGLIEVHAEGLPPGVAATTQTIRPTGVGGRPGVPNSVIPASGGVINLKVDAGAEPDLGELRLVATARPEGGPPITHRASAAIAIDVPLAGSVATRPVLRTVDRLPVRILGTLSNNTATPTPPAAPVVADVVAFESITVPGVLLQGGRIDLTLGISPPTIFAQGAELAANVAGTGLATQTSVVEPQPGSLGQSESLGLVRVIAAVNAPPGVHDVAVTITPRGGPPLMRTASIIVRPPIVLRTAETVVVAPGQPGKLRVSVARETGFEGQVDLKIDAPAEVRVVGRPVIPSGETVVEILLKASGPLISPGEVRIAGIARMPRGPVRVESAFRPMLVNSSAEKKD